MKIFTFAFYFMILSLNTSSWASTSRHQETLEDILVTVRDANKLKTSAGVTSIDNNDKERFTLTAFETGRFLELMQEQSGDKERSTMRMHINNQVKPCFITFEKKKPFFEDDEEIFLSSGTVPSRTMELLYKMRLSSSMQKEMEAKEGYILSDLCYTDKQDNGQQCVMEMSVRDTYISPINNQLFHKYRSKGYLFLNYIQMTQQDVNSIKNFMTRPRNNQTSLSFLNNPDKWQIQGCKLNHPEQFIQHIDETHQVTLYKILKTGDNSIKFVFAYNSPSIPISRHKSPKLYEEPGKGALSKKGIGTYLETFNLPPKTIDRYWGTGYGKQKDNLLEIELIQKPEKKWYQKLLSRTGK